MKQFYSIVLVFLFFSLQVQAGFFGVEEFSLPSFENRTIRLKSNFEFEFSTGDFSVTYLIAKQDESFILGYEPEMTDDNIEDDYCILRFASKEPYSDSAKSGALYSVVESGGSYGRRGLVRFSEFHFSAINTESGVIVGSCYKRKSKDRFTHMELLDFIGDFISFDPL